MSKEEQIRVKEKYFNEALRYLANAYETLKKAGKDGKYYNDAKYVKTACGTAYSAVLVALEGYLKIKDIPKPRNRHSKEYFVDNLALLDRKLLQTYNAAYNTLHLSGYYDGNTNVAIIQEGFKEAELIIQKIKP